MHLMAHVGQVKEERGTGIIPTFTYTRFGYFLSQVIQSLRSGINVEAKLYALFHERLFKVQPDSQSFVIFTSNWIKKCMRKDNLVNIFRYLKR
jgi:hypothetical protein